jgi:hypothetical protein
MKISRQYKTTLILLYTSLLLSCLGTTNAQRAENKPDHFQNKINENEETRVFNNENDHENCFLDEETKQEEKQDDFDTKETNTHNKSDSSVDNATSKEATMRRNTDDIVDTKTATNISEADLRMSSDKDKDPTLQNNTLAGNETDVNSQHNNTHPANETDVKSTGKKKCRIRKEVRDLSTEELHRFISAMQTLYERKVMKDFAAMHEKYFDSFHKDNIFLPW